MTEMIPQQLTVSKDLSINIDKVVKGHRSVAAPLLHRRSKQIIQILANLKFRKKPST